MHCHDVVREVAAPSGSYNPAAIEEHLVGCVACKAWAERAKDLDRLWRATRPPEPTTHVWDTMWARLATAFETSEQRGFESPTRSGSSNGMATGLNSKYAVERSSGSSLRNLALIGLIGVAQAAAVLLAVGLGWNSADRLRPPHITGQDDSAVSSSVSNGGSLAVNPPPTAASTVEIDEGQLVVVVICNQGESSTVLDRTPKVTFLEVDDWYLFHSAMESEAQPKVAMKD